MIAATVRPRGLFLLPDVILFPSVVEHPHYSIHPAPTLIFKEPKFCSFTKAQSEGPSIGRRTRSKSDYFHWDPPFSTCHLTVSLPLCSPWRKPSIFVIMEPGEGCIIAFTAIYFRSKRDTTAPPSITSSPPYIYIYFFFLFLWRKKKLGHTPQRNTECFNSFTPFFLSPRPLFIPTSDLFRPSHQSNYCGVSLSAIMSPDEWQRQCDEWKGPFRFHLSDQKTRF